MIDYEYQIRQELANWERKFLKPPGMLERTSKLIGTKINTLLPDKVHTAITAAVKAIVRTTLFGAEYTPKRMVQVVTSLQEADAQAQEAAALYQKIAVAEGAGTGAGGIMLSVVDFPALIAIKIKFLFELAHIYGCDTQQFSERIFILTLFQMTYSGPEQRERLLRTIQRWNDEKLQWSSDSEYYKQLDWDTFQKEYRDSLDFRKMLQLVPGIGAVAGAWANYSILEELAEAAMNSYRTRLLSQ